MAELQKGLDEGERTKGGREMERGVAKTEDG